MSTAGGKRSYAPDPKPGKRTKNAATMRALHAKGGLCVICGERNVELHHVRFRSQGGSDVPGNLVMLCPDCHLLVHTSDRDACRMLGQHISAHRPDVLLYIRQSLGEEAGSDWLRRRLFIK